MKKVVLLLFVGGLALLVIQNWGPTLPLIVFGSQTIALPAAAWIFGAIAAGLLTSALLQLLNYRPLANSSSSKAPIDSSPRRDFEERRFDRSRTQEVDSSEWETPPPADWETKPASRDAKAKTPPPREADPPPPSTSTKPFDPEPPIATGKQDRVYDADYRVIAPPYPEPDAKANPDEEEDWGFDDDEFESEYRRSYRDPSANS